MEKGLDGTQDFVLEASCSSDVWPVYAQEKVSCVASCGSKQKHTLDILNLLIQMCSKCDVDADCQLIRSVAIAEGKQNAGCSCSLIHMRSSSQISAVNTASKSYTFGFVYKRRKLQKRPVNALVADVFANTSSSNIHIVYQRRKLQRDPVTVFSAPVSPSMPPNAKSTAACITVVRSENLLPLATEKYTASEAQLETEAVISSMSMKICDKEPVLTNSETVDECLAEEHGSDVKDKMNRIPQLYSMDDSCSSSMLNVDLGSASLKNEADDTGECSSSGGCREAFGEDLSEKDLCISILKSHGLLSVCWPNGTCSSGEDVPSCSGSGSSLLCNVCGHLETAKNMLICDYCEQAFHVSCCNPFVKKIPVDEWYCQSCYKKKHIIMKPTKIKKSPIIRSEASSRNTASKGELGPIALMLKDTEPYTTGVRIGKAFQADVPDWSGPVAMATDVIAEPMELDLSGTFSLPEFSSSKCPRSNSIGNWLQCREVIVGLGEGRDGSVCGKWRRYSWLSLAPMLGHVGGLDWNVELHFLKFRLMIGIAFVLSYGIQFTPIVLYLRSWKLIKY
ncbi:hypothetical protein Ancab_017688 [Ancistrocladus abbreviatus]